MLKMFKILTRNKYFYIFAFLIILLFPNTFYMQSDKDTTLIVTAVGIDKKDEELSINALAVIPKGGTDINENLQLYEGKGKTISEALNDIATNTGKNVGLAHCDCIILSNDILQENITKHLDYFIRTANLTTNASLVATDKTAKEILEATKSSNEFLDLSLKNIVMFQEERSLLNNTNIEKFYRHYFSENSLFYMPLISIEKEEEKGSESQGTGDSSSTSSNSTSESGGSNSSGDSQGKSPKIVNKDKIVIIKEGVYLRELNDDEDFIYNLLNPKSKELFIEVDNVSDQYLTESKETYEQVTKFVLPSYNFKENIPIVTYNIWMSIMIDEVSGENFSYASIDALQNFLSPTVEELIHKQIEEKKNTTIELMRKDDVDILDLYNKFNALHHNKWEKYLNSLEDKTQFLDGIELDINIQFNYVI